MCTQTLLAVQHRHQHGALASRIQRLPSTNMHFPPTLLIYRKMDRNYQIFSKQLLLWQLPLLPMRLLSALTYNRGFHPPQRPNLERCSWRWDVRHVGFVSYATLFSILHRLSVVIEVALQSIACASLETQAKFFRVATIQAF